jgi:O-antigen ligase
MMYMKLETTNNSENSFAFSFIRSIVYIFFILFPFINYYHFLYAPTGTRSVNLIILTIISIFFLGLFFWNKRNTLVLKTNWLTVPLFLYIVFIVLSIFTSLNPEISFWSVVTRTSGVWYLLHLTSFILTINLVFNDYRKITGLIKVIVFSTAIYSVLSLFGPEGFGLIFSNMSSYDGFTFGNSTFAGMYIVGAFLLAVYLWYTAENRKIWMYILPILILINPYIISIGVWKGVFGGGILGEARSSSIAVILSLILLTIAFCLSKIKDQKKLKLSVYSSFIILIVSIVLTAISLFSSDGYVRKIYLEQATAARPIVWDVALDSYKDRSLFGWGIDNFERMFELNYDNRLLQSEYGNEAWFDKAHNIFVDQLVDGGIIGLSVYLLLYVSILIALIYCAINIPKKEDKILAVFILVYFIVHLVELQTAFDTTNSYPIVALMIALTINLFSKINNGYSFEINANVKRIIIILLFFAISLSFFKGIVPFVKAQNVNGIIRTIGSGEKRIPLYPILFSSPVDEHGFLWRASTDFQRGIMQNPSVIEDPKLVKSLKQELEMFESQYKEYILKNPEHFRSHLNLADILIYQRLFGVDKLAEAQEVLDKAILLVPQSPQSYWMKSVAYVYMNKFKLAKEFAIKAKSLNEKSVQSDNILKYVIQAEKDFPNIDLYFFNQI